MNEKKADRVFTLHAQVMGWRHGTCDHFVVLSFHEGVFLFHLRKMPLDKLGFLVKPKIRLEVKSTEAFSRLDENYNHRHFALIHRIRKPKESSCPILATNTRNCSYLDSLGTFIFRA